MDRPTPRALVVDDDPSVSRLMWRCLSMWGWAAEECHSVSGALTLFRSTWYDLALCDVDLPDGDGISLATALSKAKPSLLVVVVSGNPENVNRARQSGLRCLQKPFDLDALKALIENRPQSVPS